MWTPEYFVRILDLPPAVEGVTLPNDDGTFDIYLNSRLSPRRRKECLEHELRHIFRDHFYSERPVEDLEREADGLTPASEPEPEPKKAPEIVPAKLPEPETPPKAVPAKAPKPKRPPEPEKTPEPPEGKKREPRETRDSGDFINVFALPDPTLVPIFASIADLYAYTRELAENIGK